MCVEREAFGGMFACLPLKHAADAEANRPELARSFILPAAGRGNALDHRPNIHCSGVRADAHLLVLLALVICI